MNSLLSVATLNSSYHIFSQNVSGKTFTIEPLVNRVQFFSGTPLTKLAIKVFKATVFYSLFILFTAPVE